MQRRYGYRLLRCGAKHIQSTESFIAGRYALERSVVSPISYLSEITAAVKINDFHLIPVMF